MDNFYADLATRLQKTLRLEHKIVAMGLSDNPPANLTRYTGPAIKACQMIDLCRFEGKSFYTLQEDHYECKNAIRWLGFDESYEGHLSGEWAAGDYPDNGRALFRAPAFCRRMYMEAPLLVPRTVKCVYFSPLEDGDKAPLRGDEVLIIICNPRQGLYLSRSLLYSCGGISWGMTGPGTCHSIVAGPFLHRQAYYSLGCFGARQFMKVKGEELFFGIPIEQLRQLVDDAELLLKRRPDLEAQLDEPVNAVHEATEFELRVQKAKGKMLTKDQK